MRPMRIAALLLGTCLLAIPTATAQDSAQDDTASYRLVYEGSEGPGKGKHVVLLAGDEEYRSEEALPMLARILAVRHGFKCTVLFSLNPETGEIDPDNQTNVPGMEVLAEADMMVLFFRFRELPDADMKHFVDYLEAGKPILGIRTSTHAFDYKRNKESPYAKYHWRSGGEWKGGFGQHILGETWVNHHGRHGGEATRGVAEPANAAHPILRGVEDVFGPTDVYGVKHLPDDATILMRGEVVAGMKPSDPGVEGKKNDPMMPLIWLREPEVADGVRARIACSTIGASVDLKSEGLRRVFVNTCYWGIGIEDQIPEKSDVEYVGKYEPTFFGFGKYVRGIKPADLALKD